MAALAAVLGILHAYFFVGDLSGYDSVGVGWTIDSVNFWGGAVRMLFPFTVGMLLARKFSARSVKGAFGICSALLIVVFSVPYMTCDKAISINSLYEVICSAIVFPFIVWLGACGKSENKITSRINRFLGDISYPLYIVHYPIMYVFYKWLIENQKYTLGETFGASMLVIVLSVLLAYACLKLYDIPVRRWLTKKLIKR